MAKKHIGTLHKHDPIHKYLSDNIFPQMASDLPCKPEYRIFQLHDTTHNNQVYLYEEKGTRKTVVGKFFGGGNHLSLEKAGERARREFHRLKSLREVGLGHPPHKVVQAFGYNPELRHLLVEEYVVGDSLCKILMQALSSGYVDILYNVLSPLAYFLATMHNRTANGCQVDFNEDCAYFNRLVEQLKKNKGLSYHDAQEFYGYCARWRERPNMWEDQQVLVHGDATPPNFIFRENLAVTAIDFERMKYADRVFDLGRIVGEIQHYFIHHGRSKEDAEPYIGHFLWEYARHFPNHHEAFRSITARLPFQIAITLMRIARNTWISPAHSYRLLYEAKRILNH